MRINKKTTSKKPTAIILVTLVIVLLLAAYVSIANANNFWPFSAPQTQTSNPQESNPDNTADSNTGDVDNTTPEDTDSSDYINPPLQDQPKATDPYPIENEKYRIAQTGTTSFDVTLYPIANNPEYSDYNAQLKDYKTAVLKYLTDRHGPATGLTITWNPSDAQNL